MTDFETRLLVNRPTDKKKLRIIRNLAPKMRENPKKLITLLGNTCSREVQDLLRDINKLKQPFSKNKLTKKNKDLQVFDSIEGIKNICKSNDCSLFAIGNNNKKRPHNLILGRMFDYEPSCMLEFGVDVHKYNDMQSFSNFYKRQHKKGIEKIQKNVEKSNEKSFIDSDSDNESNKNMSEDEKSEDFHFGDYFENQIQKDLVTDKILNKSGKPKEVISQRPNSKPAILLQGDLFDNNELYKFIGNFFIDFFQGFEIKNYNLARFDHIIVLTASTMSDNENSILKSSDPEVNKLLKNNQNNDEGLLLESSASLQRNKDGKKIRFFDDNVIYFRHYQIKFQKSEQRIPFVELQEIGPAFEIKLRRFKINQSVDQAAYIKETFQMKPKKKKNISTTTVGDKVGRIYINRKDQDLDKFNYKRPNILRNFKQNEKKRQKILTKQKIANSVKKD